MDNKKSSLLLLQVILVGLLLAILAYLFHPETGYLSISVNGEPVASPLARGAAVPVLAGVLLVAAAFGALIVLGAGTLLLVGFLVLGIAGIGIMAPYLWPLLAIVLLVYALGSFGANSRNKP